MDPVQRRARAMGRPHSEARRVLIAARVSLAATHSVAKMCSAKKTERLLAKGLLLAMESGRWAAERERTAGMG